MLDEEAEELDHPNVEDDDLSDDLDDYISENDTDDDDDMNELFSNIYLHPDPATDIEFDEEEDE